MNFIPIPNQLTKLYFFFLATFFLFIHQTSAQTFAEQCGQVSLLQHLDSIYPGFIQNYDKTYKEAVRFQLPEVRKKEGQYTYYTYDTVYTIPVVVHVIYNTGAENISNALINSQIDVLNECWRKRNADTVNTRALFKSRAGDTRIQFALATKDPNGNNTTGIVRVATAKTSFECGQYADEMKFTATGGDDAWDPTRYLNIWIADLRFYSMEALLGYAFPPNGHPNWPSSSWVADKNQGVVLHYKIVGKNNPLALSSFPSNAQGKVAVHEVGHYFGLRHIWGDATNQTRCLVDDYIDDTPLQGTKSNNDCNKLQNSCTGGTNDEPDNNENYMDYSSHVCQTMFTKRQIQVMRNSITLWRFNLPILREIDSTKHVVDTVLYDKFDFYPVANQQVYFELTNDKKTLNYFLKVHDLSGRLMVNQYALNKNEQYLSTRNFAPGLYVFTITDSNNNKIKQKKLFISKP